jgi:hypothetical protein
MSEGRSAQPIRPNSDWISTEHTTCICDSADGGQIGEIGGGFDPRQGADAPNVQFERLADQAGLNDFDGATETAACASLVAHLGGDLLLFGEVTQVAGLENRVGQRFRVLCLRNN